MKPRIARRHIIRFVAIDAVALPAIALALLTQHTLTGLLEAVVILVASSSLQALVLVQGVRESRAIR